MSEVAEYRQAIDSGDRTEKEIETSIAVEIMKDFQYDQRRVAPGELKKVTFRGLDKKRMEGTDSRLRFLFHCGSSDTHEVHPVIFAFPKTGEFVEMQYVPTVGSFLSIPGRLVEDDGTLEMEIINASHDPSTQQFLPAEYSLNWDKEDLEVLFKISDFEANFVRAMLVDWFKLAFLGILSVVTGAFLSFPVACLLSFAVFIGGSIAPFLGLSLDNYSPKNFVEQIISGIAYAVHSLFYRFGAVKPSQMLIEGRLISWEAVFMGMFWLLIVWAGIALLVGFLAFRKKELAIYSGQG